MDRVIVVTDSNATVPAVLVKELDIRVVPVGLAWLHYDQLPEASRLRLRQRDKYDHATRPGAYLTGCTFYASLFNDNPLGLRPWHVPGEVTPEKLRDLQEAAFWAVSQYR